MMSFPRKKKPSHVAQVETPWPSKCALGFDAQHSRRCACGDDQAPGFVRFLSGNDRERAAAQVHRGDCAGLELRAKALRLFARILNQFRSQNAIGKSREIFHHGRQRQLAARLVAVQHQRIQVRARRIDRRSKASAATPDNNHLMH